MEAIWEVKKQAISEISNIHLRGLTRNENKKERRNKNIR